jgi:uncharacterized ferritin-like protein (DUF455 family)
MVVVSKESEGCLDIIRIVYDLIQHVSVSQRLYHSLCHLVRITYAKHVHIINKIFYLAFVWEM